LRTVTSRLRETLTVTLINRVVCWEPVPHSPRS
jgi:hypothetical protein